MKPESISASASGFGDGNDTGASPRTPRLFGGARAPRGEGLPWAGFGGARAPVVIGIRPCANRCGHIIHGEAILPEDCSGICNRLRETAQDEHPISSQLARILCGRIVAGRQGARAHLDEAGKRLILEAAKHFLLAGRKESRNGNYSMPGLFYDFIDRGLMLFKAHFAREAHVEKKWRGEQKRIANCIPLA